MIILELFVPLAKYVATFALPYVDVSPAPCDVKVPPAGLVITNAVALALIVAPPKSIVLPARYKSLNRCVGLPRS